MKKEIASIPVFKRSSIVKNVASLLEKDKERLAKLIAIESGKPIRYTFDEAISFD